MRSRPRTFAAVAISTLALGFGVWSCKTSPARPALARGEVTMGSEPEVRVRIRSGVQSVKLDGPKVFTVQRGSESPRSVEGPLTVAVAADGVRISDGKAGTTMLAGWMPIDIKGGMDSTRIRVDNSMYPGHVRILPRSGGSMAEGSTAPPRLDVIDMMLIEDYLVGVVGAELYPDWKTPGVFAVQAVCARTYALHERQRSLGLKQEWDLESTEEDQAFKGGTPKVEALRAVRETRGVVLTWSGHLLRAYYSSTCGGRVAAAADVWPTGPGYEFNLDAPIQAYHRETMCDASPRYRWEVTRDRATFSKQLRDWGKAKNHAIAGIGLFRSLEKEKVNADNRPSRFTITDGAGKTFSITAELLRNACNYRLPGAPPLARDTLVRSGDIEIEVKGNNAIIRGRGFGHGVGMCQFCAKAMADRGDTWQSMVMRFYPGAKIERAY